MNILKKSQGMAVIGWLLFLALFISVLIIAIQIAKIYVNSYRITNTLNLFKTEMSIRTNVLNPDVIKEELLTRFKSDNIPEITADEITVTEVDKTYYIKIKHQLKEPVLKNLYLMQVVDESVNMPIIYQK